jgi:peptide/nickel transport system permease protein
MYAYIAKRIFQMIVVLFIISIAVFSLILLIPGDVATALLGLNANETDLQIVREKLGLDQPFHIQYLKWLGNVLHGDFGRSLTTKHPVSLLFAQRLPVTIQLALFGMLLAVLIGLPAGIIAARRQNSFVDMILRAFTTLGMAMPNFWLGLLLILVFSLWLRWLPSSGVVDIRHDFFGWLKAMILPAITIGARFAAVVVRQTRSAMLEVLRTDYVRTARAKGLSELAVTGSHALRNALIPVVTVIGLQTGRLFGGAVITETIFSLPGMGSLIAVGVSQRDFVVVQAGVMIAAVAVLGINLLVDILYAVLDPRIRYGQA